MSLADAIAKHLRQKTGRGDELEGVPAPIVTAIVRATIEALDDRLGDAVTFPLVGLDHEKCEACEMIFEVRHLAPEDDGAFLCEACAREVRDSHNGGG